MKGQLLFLDAAPDGEAWRVSYAAFDHQGRIKKSASQVLISEIENDGSPLTVLLPGPETVLLRAEIPAKNRRQAQRAAPFALEEQLAGEVDSLHFALGPRQAGGVYPVAVVARVLMETLLARLAEAGWRPAQVLPAMLALPLAGEDWSVAAYGDLALVRSGAYSGFAIEQAQLAAFLRLAESAPFDKLRDQAKLQVLQGPLDLPPEIPSERRDHAHGILGWFAETLASRLPVPLNLLDGDFRREDSLSQWWRVWRLSAFFLVAWALIQLGGQWLAVSRLEAQRADLQQRIEAAYREAFPDTRHLVNPRAQMEQQLAALRAAASGPAEARGLAELLARLAGPLSQAEGLLLKRLDYRSPRLDLELELPSLQVWESLRQRLSAQNLAVDMQYTSSRDNRVETRLRVQPKN